MLRNRCSIGCSYPNLCNRAGGSSSDPSVSVPNRRVRARVPASSQILSEVQIGSGVVFEQSVSFGFVRKPGSTVHTTQYRSLVCTVHQRILLSLRFVLFRLSKSEAGTLTFRPFLNLCFTLALGPGLSLADAESSSTSTWTVWSVTASQPASQCKRIEQHPACLEMGCGGARADHELGCYRTQLHARPGRLPPSPRSRTRCEILIDMRCRGLAVLRRRRARARMYRRQLRPGPVCYRGSAYDGVLMMDRC